ncbi:Uncharacterized MFS-type transporter [hydrothermal vent metagenome]|uniref:Uncharacterized MFS-type transporter n=1 Tax=hydrothermal vent metagenome TaxID=652676 RepID=A0A3B0TXN3_9ZZZZ
MEHRFVGRNITMLSLTQAITGSSQSIVISVGALAGIVMAPSRELATVPITAMIVGLALSAFPATYLIHRLGRRNGFIVGAMLAFIAGLAAGFAVFINNFILFSAALALVGSSAAFGQQYRFAIADSVPEAIKGRAISFVLLGGVLAGFVGPKLAFVARNWVGGAQFSGSFLAISMLAVIAIVILTFTRLAPTVSPSVQRKLGRSTGQLLRDPLIFVPIITAMASYALMTFVMVAAPLSMVTVYGHSVEAATTTIQWHVVAMYGPSFITGFLISRFGAHLMAALGLFLILIASLVALNGVSVAHFIAALMLLGLGWNFAFIGATTLLTNAYSLDDAIRAQGINEQFVFGSMALASVGSGVLLQLIGWKAVNILVIPIAILVIGLLLWTLLQARYKGRPAE